MESMFERNRDIYFSSLPPGMSKLDEVGNIYKTGSNDNTFSFEWWIPPSVDSTGDYYSSPYIQACGGRWRLLLWPNGKSDDRVALALVRRHKGPPETMSVTLGIKRVEGVVNKKQMEREFSEEDGCWYCHRFTSISELDTDVLMLYMKPFTDIYLIITCDLRKVAPRILRDASSQTDGEFSGAEAGNPTEKKELPSEVLVLYSFKELETATQKFAEGCIIGKGAFGTVYRAVIRGNVVAVKKLMDPMDEQFLVELKTLINYKHENLLPLLGCSALGTTCCLLYEFMLNGSLHDRLYDDREPLSWQTRLSIAYGSALGINHMHTFGEKPMVHRDIKSANILLDRQFTPKVGDFGLVRTGSSGGSSVYAVTDRFCGTSVYMPREAFVGDVSVKWDTFSFGMVLLELLTGLPPYDKERKHRDLISHMEDCEDILPRLDPSGDWNQEAATELYKIARRCITESKRSRPYISEILDDLKRLSLLR